MLKLKEGVRLASLQPQMLVVVLVMNELYAKNHVDCTITSAADGKHKDHSSHYSGNAMDFRIWGLSEPQCKVIVSDAQSALGEDFYVLLESDHIHVQYKPRRPLSG